jgi:Uma2 family endonuclease
VLDKVATYLRYGTRMVWVVDPVSRSISVHAPDTTPVVVPETATIAGGEVLPGFAMTVGDLLDGTVGGAAKKRAAKPRAKKGRK